jgi:SAM-dependent methyltransferase
VLRRLEPELLDSLPPDSPDAIHSRRDLRVINRVMGNAMWFARTVSTLALPGEAVLELGAGTGELCHRLRALTPAVDGLDRMPAPSAWPRDRTWHQTDIQAFTGWAAYPVVIGNLILHHFDDDALRALGNAVKPHARVLIFNEPTRQRRGQLIWAVAAPLGGANAITRHDGHVSIAAGFTGDELPHLLGLDPAAWRWEIRTTWIGAYRFVATRRT